ncbi:MAG: hypothetical protein LBV00_12180 [Propionibacteriaceae bacterium]|jgi:CobQ-like glutamine amidotransferase family enzyme|nr:hypothetical protein [Propionibacteriaceae bacterium]
MSAQGESSGLVAGAAIAGAQGQSPLVLDVLWLYPDILNLHGDRGNAMALKRVATQLGVTTRIQRVERLGDRFDLDQADLILVGPGELAALPAVVDALCPMTEQLREFVNVGKGFYLSGPSAGLVASRTTRCDGSVIEGLGLLDLDLHERQVIYGDDLIIACGDQELNGIQIRMVNYHLGPDHDQAPLGRVLYGLGNSGEQPDHEGVRRKNLIATNLLGPALVKNPWFTARYIREVLTRKYHGLTLPDPDPESWAFERQGAVAARRFNQSKKTLPGVLQLL